jgi:hypothetical protein
MLRSCVLAGVVLGCSAAAAAAEPVAELPARVPFAAQGGWIAWSTPAPGDGWQLTTAHDGVVAAAPLRPRARPWDVDLGTTATGRVVATFSRCARAPRVDGGGVRPESGRGCRVHVADLASGRESIPRIRRPRGASDTTPTMWRGRIAFARRDATRHRRQRILLWSPRTRRTTRLPGGRVPSRCPYPTGCRGQARRGTVQGMDLGGRSLAFSWAVLDPALIGVGYGWELRADRLVDRRGVLIGSGYVGGACESVLPSAPVVDGAHAWFAQRVIDCDAADVTAQRYDPRHPRSHGASGALPADVLALARDAGGLVLLRGPTTCPCTLERTSPPALTANQRGPFEPFY